jgi:hypothetical protein
MNSIGNYSQSILLSLFLYSNGLVGGALVGAAGGYLIGEMKSSLFKVALMLVGIAWFVLYVMPTVKYPLCPEALFAAGAAGTYQSILARYSTVSGLGAFAIAFGFQKKKERKGHLELSHFILQ